MAGGRVYNGSNMTTLLPNENLASSSSRLLESFWIPNSSPTFHGGPSASSSKSMVNYENVHGGDTSGRPLFQSLGKDENMDDDDDDFNKGFRQPEKKRRLTASQVQFLEKSFEVENKLEPERKVQLAKEIGLQPRQIAIWFQNRRARHKTKQLEKDFDSLKACYDTLKAEYDSLLNQKEKLKNEALLLKDKLSISDKESANSEPCGLINPLNAEPIKPIPNSVSEKVAMVVCKQEDASSVKSDVFNSDSPNYTYMNHSSLLDPGDSSHAFEADQSDFSQDDDDMLGQSVLPPLYFSKLEDECYHDPPANSSSFGFVVEDQPFWF